MRLLWYIITLEAPNMAQKRTDRRSASVTGCGNTLHILFVNFFFVFLNEYDIIINTGSIRHCVSTLDLLSPAPGRPQ